MKKLFKILSLSLVLLVIVSAFAVAAFARGGEMTVTWIFGETEATETVSEHPDYSVGDYAPYKNGDWRASYKVTAVSRGGNNLRITLDPEDACYFAVTQNGVTVYVGSAELGAVNGTQDYLDKLSNLFASYVCDSACSEVKLLSDVVSYSGFSFSDDAKEGSIVKNGKEFSLDVNGFNLIFTKKNAVQASSNGTAVFGVSNTSFYLYSSRPGGNVFHAEPEVKTIDATEKDILPVAHTLFYLSGKARCFIGSYKGAEGDNLSVYSNLVADVYNANQTENEHILSIDGGFFYRYKAECVYPAMFYIRDGANYNSYVSISVKNASLNAVNRVFYFYNSGATNNPTRRVNVYVENCVLNASGRVVYKASDFTPQAKAYFKDCYFLSEPTDAATASIVEMSGTCRFVKAHSAGNVYGNYVFAREDCNKQVTLKSNAFKFTNYKYVEDLENSSSKVTADFDLSSLVTTTQTVTKFSYVLTDAENTANITWIDLEENEITETWLKGVNPNPPFHLPNGGETYNYTFGQKTVSGDATYTLKKVVNFNLKHNISLQSDFLYNVYLPDFAADYVKEIRVSSANCPSAVLTGVEGQGERATIDGVYYTKYFFNVAPAFAADEYFFEIDVYTDDGKTEYFTQVCEMSIPSYSVEILYNPKYSETTLDLMRKTLVYIKSAVTYFKTVDKNEYFSVIDNVPGIEAPSVRAGEKKESVVGTSLEGVYTGSTVVFGSQLRFRLFFDKDLVQEREVYVKYYDGRNFHEERITLDNTAPGNLKEENDSRCFDIQMSASNMRSDIVISSPSDEHLKCEVVYNLDNYIYFANSGDDESLKTLTYSLWDYSVAASKFVNETPEINVSIDGTPIEEYKIVAESDVEYSSAMIFRDMIEREYGIRLSILTEYDGPSIIFKSISPESTKDFEARIVDGDLLIECAFKSFFPSATSSYVKDVFCNNNRDVNVTPDRISFYTYGRLLYSDFDVPTIEYSPEYFNGKNADEIAALGLENAFYAIQHVHDIANTRGYDVYAEEGKVYYISDTKMAAPQYYEGQIVANTITVKTNTYWQGASFVIDDTNVSPINDKINETNLAGGSIFTFEDDAYLGHRDTLSALKDELNAREGAVKLSTDEKKLNTGLGYKALLLINAPKDYQHYIRYSVSTGSPASADENGSPKGEYQHDVIIVNADGTIDPSTPVHYDYLGINSIYGYKIDDKSIVVDGEGATFYTLSSQVMGRSNNVSRNLAVEASNTTLKNITHVIYNEPPRTVSDGNLNNDGHSYTGFFSSGIAYNVEFNNCVAQARVHQGVGTYDITVHNSINVRFIDCVQSNLYVENWRDNWYVMGSNFAKNILFDGCELSRFDAHCGVYNATIKNSTLTHIRLTGSGKFYMENCTILKRNDAGSGFIELREDYGSTWHGTIELKNCVVDCEGALGSNTLYCINSIWVNHNFGYQTYLPNVIIDNLKFTNRLSEQITEVQVFKITNGATQDNKYDTVPDFEENLAIEDFRLEVLTDKTDKNKTKVNVNPYIAPDFVTIKNNKTDKVYTISGATVHPMLCDTDFSIIKPPVEFGGIADTPFVDFRP